MVEKRGARGTGLVAERVVIWMAQQANSVSGGCAKNPLFELVIVYA